MIEIEHLSKRYGEHPAVSDLSVTIESGQIYGFLGPNGAGKSTTMNIMAGCLSATEGHVRIGGYDIFDEPEKAKRLIGYLPEQPPLYLNETPMEYLDLTDYVTYKVTDEELSAYGLDDPELSVSVDYTDDGTSDTLVLHISRDPAEKKSAADAEDEEASDITAYARVGDSKIIYQISGSSYRSLMAAGYNDLRHQEIFSGDFDDVTGIDITLDGETYTLTSQKDGKERTWLCEEAEIEIGDLQDALEALTAEEFTSEKAAGQQEISLTLHLDREDEPELTITLYRCDGSKCLAVVDGKSVAYVPRGEMVTLAEAVRVIALN